MNDNILNTINDCKQEIEKIKLIFQLNKEFHLILDQLLKNIFTEKLHGSLYLNKLKYLNDLISITNHFEKMNKHLDKEQNTKILNKIKLNFNFLSH